MKSIQCPQVYERKLGEKTLFLAGGITGCRIWQDDLIELLKDENLVLLNPRRENFDLNQKNINEEQIAWEFNHLAVADAVSFWFPSETLCPITLYEFGKISMTRKPLFVGAHPEYKRREDLEIQTRLARPEVNIVYSLQELAKQIKLWGKKYA
jgi:hypothetical protein